MCNKNLSILLQTDPHVKAALYSGDEKVRSDAIALICTTLKKAGNFLSVVNINK